MTWDMTMASDRDVWRRVFNWRPTSALSDRDVEPLRQARVRRPERHDALLPIRRLRALRGYGPNWDAQGARSIDPNIVDMAHEFIVRLSEAWEESELPSVVPTVVGGISLEWRTAQGEFAFEFEPRSAFEVPVPRAYYWNAASGEEWERDLRDVPPSELRASVSSIVFGE